MKRLIHEYYENYTILINNIKRFAKYIILTKLIFLAIMYPLVKATTYFLMKSKGYDYITNGILAKFLVSPQGIILLILSVILGISIILVEIGGLVVLSYQSINNLPESRFFDIVTYCLKRMKNLVRLDGVLIVIYVFVLLPLLNFGIRTSVLTTIKIPGYILDVITSNTFYFILLIISLAIIFFVTIRWIFSIHILVLAKNVKRPLSTSSKIVSKNFKGLIGYFFGMSLITLMVLLAMVFLYIILSALILMIASESVEPFIIYGLLGLGIILINISSFLFLPFQLIYITKFYLKITENYQVCLNIKYSNKKEILDKILSNKFLLVTTLVIAVISVSLYTGLFNEYFSYFNYNIKFTAHRGSSFEAPENTLAAVNRAIKLKADYVEIDIQETKDQQIVLLHDKSFKRTTGVSKEVWQLTLSEIKSLDAGVLFSKEYEG